MGGGLLRCGAPLADGRPCGSVMHGESHRGLQYRCNHAEPEGQRRHRVPAAAVDEAVWTALYTALMTPETVLAEVEALADARSQQAAEVEAEMAALDRAAAEVEGQQQRLLDLYLVGRLDADAYSAKAEDLTNKRQGLLDRAAELAARRDAAVARLLPIAEVKAACAEVAGRLDDLIFGQKQHLVRVLVQQAVVRRADDGEWEVQLEGAFESLTGLLTPDGTAGNGSHGAIVDTTSGHCALRPPQPLARV